jgi:hypothetical protein
MGLRPFRSGVTARNDAASGLAHVLSRAVTKWQ